MLLNKIPTGINVPDNVYAIIEISQNSLPVKYEINKNNNCLYVDRFLTTSMIYPCNYGYINNTLSFDGDHLDILVLTEYPLIPYSIILTKPIGLLRMQDEKGIDIKIIGIPEILSNNFYKNINSINDIPLYLKNKIKHFFKEYKTYDNNKWTKIKSFEDEKIAKSIIKKSINYYKKKLITNNI